MHSIATTAPSLPRSVAVPLPTAASLARRATPLAAPRILGNALLIMALLMLNMAGNVGTAVFFAILAVMLFVSPEAAYKSLAICYLGLMINSFFVPKSSAFWAPARIVLPFLALMRFGFDCAAYRISLLNRAAYVSLLVFCATMAVCSIVSGWHIQIALLKISYFVVFTTTVFAGTTVIRHRRSDLGEWFVGLILAAALFGVAAIALNVDNNFRSKVDMFGKPIFSNSFFNGAFGHPNVHSVYGSLFMAFLGIVWLLSTYRQPWLVLPIMACWATFIAWSASRTAFLSTAAGFLLLVLAAKSVRSRLGWRMRPRLARGTLAGILVLAIGAGLFWDVATNNSLGKLLSSYMVKGIVSDSDYGTSLSMDRILTSRRALIEFSWTSFQENPLFGVGFGVAKTEAFMRSATWLTAPVEKGFLPTAILEEGGLIGTTAFLLFLVTLSRELWRQRNVAGLVMFWTFLVTNLGEVTIFAPGGAGAFGWLTVGAAMILNDHCWTPPPAGATVAPVNHTWRR